MAHNKVYLRSSRRSNGKAPDGKLISISFVKLPFLRLVIPLCLLIACEHVPNTSCQPLFSKLAVFLRARPPRPTMYPSASQVNNVQLLHPHHHQLQQQLPHVQLAGNVYPTSSEHLQNYFSPNNLLYSQGPLSQGIPVVSMDPSQNSITIMTPTGPEQILPPSSSGAGGGVYVAQQYQPNNDNIQMNMNIKNNGSGFNPSMGNPIAFDQSNMNLNNGLPSGPSLMQVIQSQGGPVGQSIIDGNFLSGAASGMANFGGVTTILPGHFPNEQHQQFHPGMMFHASNADNNQQMANRPPPPPPPPLPKNLKGPAIIAVPKQTHPQNPVLIPAPTYLSPVDGNMEHLVNPASDPISSQNPIIIQSIHQMPHLTHPYSGQHLLLSSPENAVFNKAVNINNNNKTRSRMIKTKQQLIENPLLLANFPEFKLPHVEKSVEVELPQDPEHQTARLNILKMQPTIRPTQIPVPSGSEPNQQNEIDNQEMQASSIPEFSLTTMVNLPSTTITGSFEYPDPPTPPNFESMNALKYPSRYEDSAEVNVKDMPSVGADYGQRMKSAESLLNGIGDSDDGKKRKSKTTTTSGTTFSTSGTTAAASNILRRVTTAASTSTTQSETTIGSAAPRTTLQEIMREKAIRAAASKLDSKQVFRPSPQIHSFEEPVSGVKSYITILPPTTKDEKANNEMANNIGADRERKSLFSLYSASESRQPAYEAGFKPVNHYLYSIGQAAIPSASTTAETLYFDLIREVVSKPPATSWSEPDLTAFSEDVKRELGTSMDGLAATTTPNNKVGYTTLSSESSTDPFVKAGWKVKDHIFTGGDDGKRQLTTVASSDLVEDWRQPDTTADGSKNNIYFGNGKFGPPNCDKFSRFGFCPMNSGYPTDQVEKIASRCSALLSHLIAPLPKADVRYDVIVAKNGSLLKGKSTAPSAWSWKSFAGKPVCDTKEIKIIPGWAKNEQGEWLVILQTKAWKQEAQITLCTPQGTHYNCKGNKSSGNKNCTPIKIKCVQRFTAQRLAVLDPENTDRCPVLRSVFLPSACVCLHDNSSSSEESTSSGSSGKSSKSSSKKGSKGKSSKKSSSKSKPSSRTARSEDEPVVGSSEEENKSDIMEVAADSSTSPGGKASSGTSGNLSGKKQRHQDNITSSPEEDAGVVEDRPHAEPMISSHHHSSNALESSVNEEDNVSEQNQNEVEDDNEVGSNSTIAPTTTPVDKDDDERVTTTVNPATEESSASEE